MFQFPINPLPGQKFQAAPGVAYRWNGTAWYLIGEYAVIRIDDEEPSTIRPGEEWFESDTGNLYMRYINPDLTFTWVGINVRTKGDKGDPGPPGSPIPIACGDETSAITVGAAKVTFRMPSNLTLTRIRASVSIASTSGIVTVNVRRNGVSLFSTPLTIDVNETTSATAATPAVLAATALADDDEIIVDVDTAGTGAVGLKVYLI